MSNISELSSPFDGWENQSFSQRLQNYGKAKLAAKDTHRINSQNARRALEANNPDAYAEIIAEERLAAAARREAAGKSIDPITNPVAAYYEERERMGLERTADEDNRDRRLQDMLASGDPIMQYHLEMEVKEVAEFGPQDQH